jgi:hypothetical protein
MPQNIRSYLTTAIVALLLCTHWWLAVSASMRFCSTFDEVAHLTGGYSYWLTQDYRLHPENGILPQRLAAAPLLAQDVNFPPPNEAAWKSSSVWRVGNQFFYESGNPVDYYLLLGRSTIALISCLLGLVIFIYSQRIWKSPVSGLFSLTLYCFSPAFLAHGALTTSDITTSLLFLLCCIAWWHHARCFTTKSWLISAVCFGLMCITKFSVVLLIPMFVVMAAIIALNRSTPLVIFGREYRTFFAKFSALAVSTFLQGLVAGVIIWSVYGFRFSAFATELTNGFYLPSKAIFSEGALSPLIEFALHWKLLPEAYLYGFGYVLYFSSARYAYLLGEVSTQGWWYFFPYAFLVKTPLPLLAAYAASIIAAVLAAFRLLKPENKIQIPVQPMVPLAALFAVYWIFSITSNLNIGDRHILPTIPPLLILCGILAAPSAQTTLKVIAGFLALGTMTIAASNWPKYLAYFNPLIGDPNQAHRHLVDSSLDWGQDLPALADWLKSNRGTQEAVYLAYFGSGSPAYYGINSIPLVPVLEEKYPIPDITNGGLYCISATQLVNVNNPWFGPWDAKRELLFVSLHRKISAGQILNPDELSHLSKLRIARLNEYLRLSAPIGVINHSIFVYRLTDEQAHAATGPDTARYSQLFENLN